MVQASAPNLSARVLYGLRTDIQFNAHFLSESEILYPAGEVLVIHNHLQKKQKFIRLPDKTKTIKALVLAPNRRWLALNEVAEADGLKPVITIYDLNTYKRRKILTVPFENYSAKEFACIAFTHDSKYLMAVTGEPDWYLYTYNWDKGKVESYTRAQNPTGWGTVKSVYCNPTDNSLIVITGPQTFRIMSVSETVWRQWGWSKVENLNITACMWLTPDRILFGTDDGLIMVVEEGEIRHSCVFKAFDVTEMSFNKADTEAEDTDKFSTSSKQDSQGEDKVEDETFAVTNFVNFQKGFAFCCGPGYVHMFERESMHFWRKRNVFRISRRSYVHAREYPVFSPLDAIQHLIVDPNQETLVITTLRKQLYYVKLFGLHMLQNPEIPFTELGPAMHYGRINSLSVCAWKPIFMTSGAEDNSVRIWNYTTDEVEIIRLYQEEITCVSLHPTGLFTLIGFSDKLRFMVVLLNDFETIREYTIRYCKQAKFSTNGHLFAAIHGHVIQVFSSVSFDNVYNLKGHEGKITCLSWSANDSILVSCGLDGAVYEWSMNTGQRVGQIILPKIKFNSCATNRVGKTTYAVGIDGELREIGASSVRRSLPLIGCELDNIILSRSDIMIFLSGGEGGVTAVQLPLFDKAIFSEFHMHNKKVLCIALSYDDQTLISVAEDSSVCMWRLTNADGRAVVLDKDFSHSQQVLISKKDLQEKINTINMITAKMNELETNHARTLLESETAHIEKLDEVHAGYSAAIEELKEKNEQLDADHTQDIGAIQKEIFELRSGHDRTLMNLESDFNIRLVGEYDRYQQLEDKTAFMRKDYGQRIEELAASKIEALKEMTAMFEAKLQEKDVVIKEIQGRVDVEKINNEEIKADIEEDADREIIEVRTSYEMQLKYQKDTNVRLKTESGIMKKKLFSAYKEIDDFKHLIARMKEESVQFQKSIANLEIDVADLRKGVSERDTTIQEKEKRIYEFRQKKMELEKYKFVLNFKITELRSQIEPKQRELKELRDQIEDMENEVYKLEGIKFELELTINQLNDKLISSQKDFVTEHEKHLMLKNILRKIKIDLHNMTPSYNNISKLKLAVKELFHKYTEEINFSVRLADDEAIREYNRLRDHLEKQLALARTALSRALGGSKGDFQKIIEDNCTLLTEINMLRADIKMTRTRIKQMESILGFTSRYIPPPVARAKLKHVAEDKAKLDKKYKQELDEKQLLIETLKEETTWLLEKVRCPEDMKKVTETPDMTPGGDAALSRSRAHFAADTKGLDEPEN